MKVTTKLGKFNLMFGTDCEFFLEKDGKIVPASKYIPGEKHNPYPLENGVCHPDGLSLEVGCPPADTPEGMFANLFKVLAEVKEKFLDPNGLKISPLYKVAVDDVDGATDKDLEFGCGAELMAWNVSLHHLNFKRPVGDTSQYRYSGFHIHLGYTTGNKESVETAYDNSRLVRVLDSALYAAGFTPPMDRSAQYGGFGAFRVKPYGLEYRALSCDVLNSKESISKLIRLLNKAPILFRAACTYHFDSNHQGGGFTHQTTRLVERVQRSSRELPRELGGIR